ncbi:hypothetical protein [Sphingomonas sp. UYP23]
MRNRDAVLSARRSSTSQVPQLLSLLDARGDWLYTTASTVIVLADSAEFYDRHVQRTHDLANEGAGLRC